MGDVEYRSLDVDYEELDKDDLITILREVTGEKNNTTNQIRNPSDILPFFKQVRKRNKEQFWALILNGAHEVIKTSKVSEGLVNKSIAHPREIYREAIKQNAVAVVIVHNHPSGNTDPSDQDREITHRVKEAGDVIGIQMLDHLVLTKNGYYSFLERNEI